ncbi:MAG: hypothetical protein JRD03_10830, partial [Deltaproteobacteria bacterium]|nr:hypothetical protein [Deltaproteobacteria bacterium]
SPRMQVVLAEVRKSLGSRHARLTPKKIDELQAFFGGEVKEPALSFSQTQALTDRFARHFNHAVPFDEDAIDAIWDRCRDLRCGTARREAERMLEDGSWNFAASEQRDAKGYLTRSLDPGRAKRDLSPESELSPESDFPTEPELSPELDLSP